MSKKLTIIISVLLFLVSTGVTFFVRSKSTSGLFSKYNTPSSSQNGINAIDEGPKTEECPLNGQMYSKAQKNKWETRRPLGVAIENHLDSRPQSGLQNADVIYEAVAEGGITRFLAIYYCDDASIIGPVRSARIYFLKLLQGYGLYPLYAHVGGANTPGPADALGEIADLGWDGYNDLSQFSVPFPTFYRDYERLPERATEHTMYSGTDKLWSFAAKSRKLTNIDEDKDKWDQEFTPRKFKEEAKAKDRGSVNKVSFGFWDQFSKDYSVVWNYNKESNTYKRTNGGVSHQDLNLKKALEFKSIVVVLADESPANDGYPGGHLLYEVVGEGEGFLFQDGKAQEITWEKTDEESMMRFFVDGDEVELNAGKLFIEILPLGNDVKY